MTNTMELVEIPVGELMPSPYQQRTIFPEEAEREMAASMAVHGVLEPVLVRRVGDEVELVAGERRVRAAKLAGLAVVPAIVKALDDKEACEVCLLENLQRENLTMLEEARSLEALVQLGFEVHEIAARIGRTRDYIFARRRVLQLPEVLTRQIEAGKVTLKLAGDLTRVPPEEQEAAYKRLVSRGLDSGLLPERQARELVQREFIEPAELAKKYEDLRGRVEGALPRAEWVPWKEAAELRGWKSGWGAAGECALAIVLSEAGRQEQEEGTLPTWGALAKRYEAAGRIAAEYYNLAELDEEERAEEIKCIDTVDAGAFLEGFLVFVMHERQPLIDAERARCEAEKVPCIFAGNSPVSQEQKEAQQEEATSKRLAAAARRKELKKWILGLFNGQIAFKKEGELGILVYSEMALGCGVCDVGWELWRELGELTEKGEEDEEWKKVERKVAAYMRKPAGGLAFLGRLLVADAVLAAANRVPTPPKFLAAVASLGVFPKSSYPILHAEGCAAKVAEEESAELANNPRD